MRTEKDRLEQARTDGTEDSPPETEDTLPEEAEAKADGRRGMGDALIVLGPLALVGYLVTRSANPAELTSVTTAASGLLVAVATVVSAMRRRR